MGSATAKRSAKTALLDTVLACNVFSATAKSISPMVLHKMFLMGLQLKIEPELEFFPWLEWTSPSQVFGIGSGTAQPPTCFWNWLWQYGSTPNRFLELEVVWLRNIFMDQAVKVICSMCTKAIICGQMKLSKIK